MTKYNSFCIAGGTGFVGKNLLNALKKENVKIRLLVRTEQKAEWAISEGFTPHLGDITKRESLKGIFDETDVAVNLVGIIMETKGLSFYQAHVEGTFNLVEEAKAAGVKLFFYQSALGAAIDSPFKYSKTKAQAEEIVKTSGLPYIIFRPSLIIGKGDGFTKSLLELVKPMPAIPVPGGGKARFQPLSIDDWVRCFLKAINDDAFIGKVIEFGGPEHLSYNEILKILMKMLGIKKPIVHLPKSIVKLSLPFNRMLSFLGANIPSISAEQIELLQVDNITDPKSIYKIFGFKPMKFEDALRKALS